MTPDHASFAEFAYLWARRQGQGFPALHDQIAGWLDRWVRDNVR